MSFLNLFPSKTVGMALTLLPLLSRAFDLDKADDWVWSKLPEGWTKGRTLQQFEKTLKSGKVFLKDVYDFLHKKD